MSSKRVALLLAALFCLFAVTPSALFAQNASTGTVAGTVTDPSGGAIVGASVTITDTSTNTTRSGVTNETGRYILVDIPSGTYNLTVSKTGFRISKLVDQQVTLGSTLTLNVTLEIGSVAETVEVTVTAGAELQTMNATVGNTITGVALQALPAIGGDVSTFVALQPGVGPDGSVAGAVVDQSTFMLDGGNNTNDMDGSMQVYTPSFGGDPTGGIAAGNGLRGGAGAGGVPTGVMPTPSDSVEEFKVNTTGQTADFNSSAGAQVQVVTRRGTNAWHGSVYEYYLDNNFNANTWDNNASGTPLPSFHYNRFGASGGGPILPKEILGGKTYFFANYQGFRWNNSVTVERSVPSAAMRLGILRFSNDGSGATSCSATSLAGCTIYNVNPFPVVDPVSGATIPGSTLDPRNVGINSVVQKMWNQFEPTGNDANCGSLRGSRCDTVNEVGFKANMSVPQNDNFGVARLDHDFGSKWHFNSSYRYYKLTRATSSQIDIGGVFAGDKLGTPSSVSSRPQQPWYFVAGLTTNITSNTTNDFHYSYLRNFWSWGDSGGAPQPISGVGTLGGALEPLGESSSALIPYNVDTQDVRTRFWDGKDNFFRDDLTMLKGNHLFTFGGAYQRNWDYHQRTDNGGGINYFATYQLGDTAGAGQIGGLPTTPAGTSTVTWGRDLSAVWGMVTDAQIAYTRVGPTLTLNPPLTPASDKSTIPYYNVYWSDSWRMKPTFTFTYGLGWTLEMPPTEAQGKQVELVDSSGQQLDVQSYLTQRKAAALQGQVYNPTVGFALVGNTGSGQKYPYLPFYGSFSPRIAAAWNPNYDGGILGKVFGHGKSVVRGGYSRVYGRLNGVDLVLVPLLGTGLIQPVQCRLANMNGTCGGSVTASNAFRVGTDGLTAPIPAASATLPQPVFPGVNNVSAAAGEALDPHFRPNVVDSFDFTIQRQITPKILVEFGYIGRRITHEYQPININAVPYMMTVGGQSFAQAYAYVETQMGCLQGQNQCGAAGKAAVVAGLTPQPFFEAALAGTGYCAPGSCTAAVVTNLFNSFKNQQVWSLWSSLDKGGIGGGPGGTTLPGFNFQRSMLNSPIVGGPLDCGVPAGTAACGGNGQLSSGVGVNASVGHGNYNGGFISFKMNNWHGVTLQQNFTISKALGTGAFVQATSAYTPNDPFNLDNMYGPQAFDRKYVYNILAVYEPPFYKNQQGILGHILGGWNLAPIFTAGSGSPLYCNSAGGGDAQAFGSGDGVNFFDNEQCVPTTPVGSGSASVHFANGDKNSPNIFANPAANYANFRAPILGIDGRDYGVGPTYGLPYWNLDLSIRKNIRISERFSTEFQFLCLNTLNHLVFANPYQQIGDLADWGALTSQGNTPRQMEFGIRLKF
jgi:carboxypeptidase family protein